MVRDSKVMPLREAAALVADGCTVGLGGMALSRRPVAFVRELLRQGAADLTLLGMTLGIEADVLVGAGRVRRVRSCYFGLESFGLAPMFTEAATSGQIEVMEETENSIILGLRATSAGVGFLPARGWLGTDLPALRPDVRTVTDPYSGESYAAFPAIRPDVAVLHARLADPQGNAVLGGNLSIDWDLSMAARQVAVTTEALVDDLPTEADILGIRVTVVAVAPHGARPTACYPSYGLDGGCLLSYVNACQRGEFHAWLQQWLAER